MGCSDLAFSGVYFSSGLEGREKLLVFILQVYEHVQKAPACLTDAFSFIIKNK